MPLSAGTQLGPYEILSPIGAGGMGAVYKARDTRLDRMVAIKVSSEQFSERFEREARAIAALNHSHICTLHDVGPDYLVMELIEGAPLKGPLPVDQALRYAAQICDALDAAHKKGIIHRDLKPANILVTKTGIKLLDFGLAKFSSTGPAAQPLSDATLTMALTGRNEIVGTLYYMSPDQLQAQGDGREIDARTDIFSFGLVLYEMLTGKRAFEGSSPASVIAAIMERPSPSITDVAPAALDRVLKRCLEKDPGDRWQSASDLQWALEDLTFLSSGGEPGHRAARSRLPWMVAASLALVTLGTAGWALWPKPTPLPAVTRFQIFAPPGSTLPLGTPAVSPDGRTLAYTVRGPDGVVRLYLRSLDSTEARALPGTEDAQHPFWSPDGRSLAFAAEREGELKRIDLSGGSARPLAPLRGPWHGSWSQAGVILLQQSLVTARIPSDGGVATPVVKLDEKKGETAAGFPFSLPDGKRFLVSVGHGEQSSDLDLASLGSMDRKVVLPAVKSAPVLATTPNGKSYLLYLRDGSLMAQEFDDKAGSVRGRPFLLVSGIGQVATTGSMPAVGVSPSGVLAYQTGGEADAFQLGWYDRSGKSLQELPREAAGIEPEVSPDGRFIAMVGRSSGTGRDIWLVDLDRGSTTRFTFGSNGKRYEYPLWSPDGKRLAYALVNAGIYVKDVNGTGAEEQLINSRTAEPFSWSPDGRQILFRDRSGLFLLPLGSKPPVPAGPAAGVSGGGAEISPDGKYFAFSTGESGREEVYLQTMPPRTGRWQISIHGGAEPKWRKDGREIYFLAPDWKMMAVDIQTGQSVTAGVPRALFQTGVSVLPERSYDVSSDGQRFLIASSARNTADAPITVVLNWWAGVRKE